MTNDVKVNRLSEYVKTVFDYLTMHHIKINNKKFNYNNNNNVFQAIVQYYSMTVSASDINSHVRSRIDGLYNLNIKLRNMQWFTTKVKY